MILGGEFHGRERRILADSLRDHLIDRGVQLDDVAFRRYGPAEERCATDRMAGLAGTDESRDDVYLIAEFLQRLQNGRELEACAFLRRRPLFHDRAVRHVDKPEPLSGQSSSPGE